MTAPAFAHTSGPRDAAVVIVGEAWGQEESTVGLPFVGSAGQELTRLLRESGIVRRDCLITNVFAFRPLANDIGNLCVKRGELPADYPWPHIQQGKYIEPQYLPEVDRLRDEISAAPRNLAIALGNTACWALLRSTRISSIRGATAYSTLVSGLKVLPTYHPAAVMRNWALRPVVIADLMKASREMAYPEIRRPERRILVNPTMSELTYWTYTTLTKPPATLAVDIETFGGQITMIGFAPSQQEAVVFPFVDFARPGKNYWLTPQEERAAWGLVRKLLESPITKIFQNGLYDLQFLCKMGMRPRACTEDTMLLHHSIYPELQKGLGFLGSCYTDESAWKLLRHTDTNKRDE